MPPSPDKSAHEQHDERRHVKVGPISGFPELLPAHQRALDALIEKIRTTYERCGFTPIETPAVERADVLTAKGGVQRQIYGLTRPAVDRADADAPEIALRFDLTVPTARFVVQHEAQLQFPLRRYQHQRVWRGERAQRGRFREFAQFDIDIIGRGGLDDLHDAEVIAVMAQALAAIGLADARIHVSHRRVLTALTEAAGLDGADGMLATIDRAGRAGVEAVLADLARQEVPEPLVTSVGRLLACTTLEEVRGVLEDAGASADGVDALQRIVESAVVLGTPRERMVLDFSIARGLDYYTGLVVETFVPGHERWGSICSGGRYDNLASHFGSRTFPGVGVSIGVTRLFDLLVKARRVEIGAATPAVVLVCTPERDRYLTSYLDLARRLRAAGHDTELFLQRRPLRDQLTTAARKGIPLVVIAGERELAEEAVGLKDMRDGVQRLVPIDELPERVAELLDPASVEVAA
ncbi:MAG TPA: histidine--tRNA ligase [Conexibacter sp.]|nr:histidine--tRNA ligase [Conexibacter sp.]